jgi:hypothetical protein
MANLAHRVTLAKTARTAVTAGTGTGTAGTGGAGDKAATSLALLEGVVAAADAVVAQIDSRGVAVELGQLADKENSVVQKRRKEAEGLRDSLVKAYAAKCQAAADMRDIKAYKAGEGVSGACKCAGVEADADPAVASLWTDFELSYAELSKWENPSTSDKWVLYVYARKHCGKYGAALQRVSDLLGACGSATGKKAKESVGSSSNREVLLEEQAVLLEMMGWGHLLSRVRGVAFLNAVHKFQPM